MHVASTIEDIDKHRRHISYDSFMDSSLIGYNSYLKMTVFQNFDPLKVTADIVFTQHRAAKQQGLPDHLCPNRPMRLTARVRKSVPLDLNIYLRIHECVGLSCFSSLIASLNDLVTIHVRIRSKFLETI